MKKRSSYWISTIFIGLVFCSFILGSKVPKETLKIGEKAPMLNHQMKSTDGSMSSIEDYKGNKGTLIIFSCNTCPFVVGGKSFEGWEKDYNDLVKMADEVGIKTILINSNEAKREEGDSFEDMLEQAKKMKYTMPYLYDEKHKIADAFGAKTTPHIFLLNEDFTLIFEGAIDNTWNPKADKKETYLIDALNAVRNGKRIKTNKTAPKGCSIKRI
jgi:peroxiredoxin